MPRRAYPYRQPSKGVGPFPSSLAEQSCKDECEIHSVLKRFAVTGILPGSGRVALSSEQFFGGRDFADVAEKVLGVQNHENSRAFDSFGLGSDLPSSGQPADAGRVEETQGGDSAAGKVEEAPKGA